MFMYGSASSFAKLAANRKKMLVPPKMAANLSTKISRRRMGKLRISALRCQTLTAFVPHLRLNAHILNLPRRHEKKLDRHLYSANSLPEQFANQIMSRLLERRPKEHDDAWDECLRMSVIA